MWCGASLMVSWPATWMEPVRDPVRPTMARMVVVRPAPLRPSSVTTSPRLTLRSTPCRMCDSPYQAFRPAMRSSSVVIGVPSCCAPRYELAWGGTARRSCMRPLQGRVGGSHVRLDHLGIFRYLGIGAVRDDGPALQYGDAVRNRRHHVHVVLDHQDGAARGHFLDQLRHPVHVLVAHALRR